MYLDDGISRDSAPNEAYAKCRNEGKHCSQAIDNVWGLTVDAYGDPLANNNFTEVIISQVRSFN